MYGQINRILAIVALVLFAYAQYVGWSPNEDRAGSHHGSGSSGGRIYHK